METCKQLKANNFKGTGECKNTHEGVEYIKYKGQFDKGKLRNGVMQDVEDGRPIVRLVNIQKQRIDQHRPLVQQRQNIQLRCSRR